MKIIIAIACTLSAYASIIHAASSSGRDEMNQNTQEAAIETLERFLNSGQPPLISYRARRVLTALVVDEAGEYRASLSADRRRSSADRNGLPSGCAISRQVHFLNDLRIRVGERADDRSRAE